MAAIATLAPTTPRTEWFATWFDSSHYHRLYAHRDQDEAGAFIDRLIDRIHPRPSARALDLGCGSGRHSRSLAARGFDVTGIDLSAGSLARARQQAGPAEKYFEQDMRRPFGTCSFDIVFSLFTSFGYFEDRGEHATVVRNMARSLRPGGVIVLDFLNAVVVERHLIAHEVVERDDVRYHLRRWSDADAFYKQIVIHDPTLAAPLEYVERVGKLTLPDFQHLFAQAGIAISAVYGDYQLNHFDIDASPRLILIATNRGGRVDRSAPRETLANPAERFGGHSQVGRQHRLRHALNDRGVGGEKVEIPLLRGRAERADDTFVLGRRMTLQAGAKGGGERLDLLKQPLVRRAVDQQQLGILDGIDEVSRGCPAAEALRISQPPGLGRELNDVFPALCVDHEVAQAPGGDERRVASDITGSLQEFAGGQPPAAERRAHNLKLGIGEGSACLQVGTEHPEHRRVQR